MIKINETVNYVSLSIYIINIHMHRFLLYIIFYCANFICHVYTFLHFLVISKIK